MHKHMCAVFLLLVSSLAAQITNPVISRNVSIAVVFDNGSCDTLTQVKLFGSDTPGLQQTVNERCEAHFAGVPEGSYMVKVSAPKIASVDTMIMVSVGSMDFEVRVKRVDDPEHPGVGGTPLVSAADLGVPLKARKEFDKANDQISRQDFSKAIQTLNRAIAIYPEYANAYNNLAVVYARLGDRDHERQALQKAIGINDHFAPAYLNLGRLDLATNNFGDAETALNKAASYDPSNSMALILLTYCQFMGRHFDDAIATSRRVHTLPGSHSSVHLIAAQAFGQKHDRANAVAELELFLKEEPTGQRADAARKDLTVLEAAK